MIRAILIFFGIRFLFGKLAVFFLPAMFLGLSSVANVPGTKDMALFALGVFGEIASLFSHAFLLLIEFGINQVM